MKHRWSRSEARNGLIMTQKFTAQGEWRFWTMEKYSLDKGL